jgi:hypothetical protein
MPPVEIIWKVGADVRNDKGAALAERPLQRFSKPSSLVVALPMAWRQQNAGIKGQWRWQGQHSVLSQAQARAQPLSGAPRVRDPAELHHHAREDGA